MISCRIAERSVAMATAMLLTGTFAAHAQIGDSKCVDRENNFGRKVSSAQNRETRTCVRDEGKATLGSTVEACLTADAKSRVQKKKDKVSDLFGVGNPCENLSGTDMVTNGPTTNAAHQTESLALIHDVFGVDLDAGQIAQVRPESKCQSRLSKRAGQLMDAWTGEFRKCTTKAFKNGASTTAAAIAACLSETGVDGGGSGLADPRGKVTGKADRLASDVQRACIDEGLDLDVVAPGLCTGGGVQGDAIACLQDLAECRACKAVAATDALGAIDCDVIDNGAIDKSCDLNCEVLNSAECLLPYPSSHFLVPDPSTATGLRVSIPSGGLATVTGTPTSSAPYNELDGFSPMTQILMHFPQGVDLELSDAGRLLAAGCCGQPAGPPWIDTRTYLDRSLDADSPSVILRADTGERVIHFLEVDGRATGGQIPGRQALFLRPGKSLEPGTRYIVAVRNLKALDTTDVVAEAAFAALRDGTPTADAATEARRDQMESEVFAPLTSYGIDRSELVLAFDFTTQSEDQLTRQMLSMRDQAFAWLATVDATPAQVTFTVDTVTPISDCLDPEDVEWKKVSGTFESPLFLDGPPVQSGVQFMNVDANDVPVQNGFMDAPYDVSIPCSVFDGGVTTHSLVLGHGIFGTGESMVDSIPSLKSLFADWHHIVSGTDWLGLSSRRETSTDLGWIGLNIVGIGSSQFNNFPAFIDRLRQGMLNQLVLGKMMKLGLFNRHTEFESAPGVGVFPPPSVEMYYHGISLGGIHGTWFSALSPDIVASALDVPAVNFPCLLQRSTQFAAFDLAIGSVGVTDPMQFALLISNLGELWVSGEPAGFVNHITSDPLPGSGGTKKILYQAAWLDKQVSNTCTEAAARSMELPSLIGSLQPGLQQIPDTAGPVDSALVMWDTGAFDLFNPAHAPHIPPLSNIIPTSVCDPHGGPRQTPAAVVQMMDFLEPGGQIANTCNGVCDAAEPLEIPGGGTCGLDSPLLLQGILCVDDADCGGGTCEATVCDPLAP